MSGANNNRFYREPVERAWEHFKDAAYYDMWCVRRVNERAFGQGFHLVAEAEAAALCELLNGNAQGCMSGQATARPWRVDLANRLREAAKALRADYGWHHPSDLMDEAARELSAFLKLVPDSLRQDVARIIGSIPVGEPTQFGNGIACAALTAEQVKRYTDEILSCLSRDQVQA